MEQSIGSVRAKREEAIAALEHALPLLEETANLSEERRDEIIVELLQTLGQYWLAHWSSQRPLE